MDKTTELLEKAALALKQIEEHLGGHEQIKMLVAQIDEHLNPHTTDELSKWEDELPKMSEEHLMILNDSTLKSDLAHLVELEILARRRRAV